MLCVIGQTVRVCGHWFSLRSIPLIRRHRWRLMARNRSHSDTWRQRATCLNDSTAKNNIGRKSNCADFDLPFPKEVGKEVRSWWGDIFQVIYYWTEEPGRWVAFSQLYLCPIFGLRRRNSGNLGPKERDEWRAGRSKEGEEQKIPTEFNTFGRCRSWCSANFEFVFFNCKFNSSIECMEQAVSWL